MKPSKSGVIQNGKEITVGADYVKNPTIKEKVSRKQRI